MKALTPEEFAQAMTHEGHIVFKCSACGSILWMEADNPETGENLQMLRYGDDSLPDDCIPCSRLLGELADPGQEWYKVIELFGTE